MALSYIDRRAQNFALDACRGRAAIAGEAADLAERLLARLRCLPSPNLPALHEAFAAIHDALSDEAGRIERALDNEHLAVDLCPVDLSDLSLAVDSLGVK